MADDRLEPGPDRAAGRPRGMAAGAATIDQHSGAAPARPADPSTTADRDGDRSTGRALPRQTDLGPGCLTPVVTLATQAPQPHLAVYLRQQHGLGSLRFADLLTPITRT